MTTETPDEEWPLLGCPPLAWPVLANESERFAWYRTVIEHYASLWDGHVSQARFKPVDEAALAALEARLGCALPTVLRRYHAEIGALSLAENLCSVEEGAVCVEPLPDAYPGLYDISDRDDDHDLAEQLVAFGDYLGNGNMFCFHRDSGEVYYFDHDTAPMMTRFFASPQDYLDGLMIRNLAEIHGDDEAGEKLLRERFGDSIVQKWLY